jgi:hypothetical protein
MSDNENNLSPAPPSPTITEKSLEDQHSDMFLSLETTLRHPSSVSNTWIDTIDDARNNPRILSTAPFDDGALHWVDRDGKVLRMSFPAVLNMYGKYAKIGPYFSLMSDQNIKVS